MKIRTNSQFPVRQFQVKFAKFHKQITKKLEIFFLQQKIGNRYIKKIHADHSETLAGKLLTIKTERSVKATLKLQNTLTVAILQQGSARNRNPIWKISANDYRSSIVCGIAKPLSDYPLPRQSANTTAWLQR